MNFAEMFVQHVISFRALAGLLVSVLTLASISNADEVSANKEVIAYSKYLDALHRVAFHATVESQFKQGGKTEGSRIEEDWDINLLGQSAHISCAKPGNSVTGKPEMRLFEQHLSRELCCTAGGSADRGEHDLVLATFPVPGDFWPRLVPWSFAAPLCGYIKNGDVYSRISDLLKESELVADDDGKCKLRAENPSYILEVTLDPGRGWMAEKVHFKGESEILFRVVTAELQGGIWFPLTYEMTESLPSRSVIQPRGVMVKEGRIVYDPVAAMGAPKEIQVDKSELTSQVALTSLRLNQHGAPVSTFLAKIPDGAKVDVVNARHLNYVWYKGAVLPFTGNVLRELGGTKFGQ